MNARARRISTIVRIWAIVLVFTQLAVRAQDALFEFSGKDPTEPTNWQKPLNWMLNGESAARVPGTGQDDRVVIANGAHVTNPSHTIKSLLITGTITGGFLNITDSLTMNGGIFEACSITLLDNAVFTSNSSGLNQFNSCIVINRGVFSPGMLKLDALASFPPTQLTNDVLTGRIELHDGTTIVSVSGAGIAGGGTIVKLAGPGSASLPGVFLTLTQSGSLECQGGTLVLGLGTPQGRFVCNRPIVVSSNAAIVDINGTASELQAGTQITGPGRVVVHHVIVSGDIEADNMELPSHSLLEGAGKISLNGLLMVVGGSLNGAANESTPGAQLVVQPSGTLRFVHDPNGGGAALNRVVQNFGVLLHEMNEEIGHSFGGAVFPSFQNMPGATITLSGSGGMGPRALTNAGTIQKIVNTDVGHSQSLSQSCDNTGLIDIQTGLIRLNVFNQTAGELRIGAGTEARFQSGPSSISGGLVTGSGTLRGLGSVTLSGTIRPGSPTGILTFARTEDFVMLGASANIEIDIGGPNLGADYDQLFLSASFPNYSLAGSLTIKLANNFTPALGQSFSVVRYQPGRVGMFSKIFGLASVPGILLVPRYNATTLDLVATTDPHLRIASVTGSSATATIDTAMGASYQFETTTDLNLAWSPIGNATPGDGLTKNALLNFTASPRRFFRVRVN